MKNFDNYHDGVSILLDKIADKLDPDFQNVKAENYSDSVVESLERIADNFDPSGGGIPRVWCSVNDLYLYKTGTSTSASNRYTAAEFKALLEDHTFAWGIYTIPSYGALCFALYFKVNENIARAVLLPYNDDQTKYTTSGTYITLSGTGYAKYSATPSTYEIPSSGGGSVLTISEYTITDTTVTEVMTAIENGSLIRLDSYGVYYPCLYSVVHQDDTTFVELQCGPYNILICEDPSANSFSYVGWPSNQAETGEG